MTYEKKFEAIQKRFATPDLSGADGKVAIQITLTDEDCGGVFYVACIDGNFEVAPYDYHDNTATLAIKAVDLTRLLNGTMKDLDKAVAAGRIEVTGNMDHIKLLPAFGMQEKKEKKIVIKVPAKVTTAAAKTVKTVRKSK